MENNKITHSVCYRCKEEKTIDNFSKSKNKKSGVHGHCKICAKIVKQEWDSKNKELNKIKSKEIGYYEKKLIKLKDKYNNDKEYREQQ